MKIVYIFIKTTHRITFL